MVVPGETQDIRCMTASAPFDVKGVDRSAADDSDGVGHRKGLVQAIGVERDLNIGFIRHAKGGVDGSLGRSGVLVHLETTCMGVKGFAD